MAETKIEWTEHSENPIRARMKGEFANRTGHYCEKVNAGCTNCYASLFQKRVGLPDFGSGQHLDNVDIFLCQKTLGRIEKRKKPTTYFMGDMTDLFGHWVKKEWMNEIMATVDRCQRHTFQFLTKRPERVPILLNPRHLGGSQWDECRENLWLGTSVADQKTAEQAIPELLKCRDLAKHLFLSVEPLVGSVDLGLDCDEVWICPECGSENVDQDLHSDDGSFWHCSDCGGNELGDADVKPSIDWVIVGGESGPKARSCNVDWVRSAVQQCNEASVACFVKQIGSNAWIDPDELNELRSESLYKPLQHPKGGDPNEWPKDLRVRQFPGEVVNA